MPGLLGSTTDPSIIYRTLEGALGARGTRLCLVNSITMVAPGSYEVRISEGACTTGQSSSEPICAFTLGVFVGAIHAIPGTPMQGRETQCCACGASECIYKADPIYVG